MKLKIEYIPQGKEEPQIFETPFVGIDMEEGIPFYQVARFLISNKMHRSSGWVINKIWVEDDNGNESKSADHERVSYVVIGYIQGISDRESDYMNAGHKAVTTEGMKTRDKDGNLLNDDGTVWHSIYMEGVPNETNNTL